MQRWTSTNKSCLLVLVSFFLSPIWPQPLPTRDRTRGLDVERERERERGNCAQCTLDSSSYSLLLPGKDDAMQCNARACRACSQASLSLSHAPLRFYRPAVQATAFTSPAVSTGGRVPASGCLGGCVRRSHTVRPVRPSVRQSARSQLTSQSITQSAPGYFSGRDFFKIIFVFCGVKVAIFQKKI
jgi:hypothetical protein